MARIAGVDLPRTKRIEIGLTYIYGIGRKRSGDVLGQAGVSPDIRVKDLSEDDVRKVSRVKSAATGASVIVATCQPVVSGRARTRARARARARVRSRRRRLSK